MKESEKEQIKLSATFLSNFSLATIVAGFLAPIAALSFRSTTSPPPDWITVTLSVVWLSIGLCLHWLARRMLRKLP